MIFIRLLFISLIFVIVSCSSRNGDILLVPSASVRSHVEQSFMENEV